MDFFFLDEIYKLVFYWDFLGNKENYLNESVF